MEELTPILIGGAVGLFIGLQLLQAHHPQIMVVQVEQQEPQSGGGIGLVILVGLVGLVFLLSLR